MARCKEGAKCKEGVTTKCEERAFRPERRYVYEG